MYVSATFRQKQLQLLSASFFLVFFIQGGIELDRPGMLDVTLTYAHAWACNAQGSMESGYLHLGAAGEGFLNTAAGGCKFEAVEKILVEI